MPEQTRLATLMSMLENEPEDAFCLYGIAQEHASRGERALAIEFYDRAIAADPAHAYAFFHKARLLHDLKRQDDAESTARSGITVAMASGDSHAASELQALLDEMDTDS